MMDIYNESVEGGGASPALGDATLSSMGQILAVSRARGWPLRVLARGDDIIGWAHVAGISWGGNACASTGDLWLYVARGWHGSGVAMLMARKIHPEILRHGFDTLTCWILAANRRSLSLVRACRLQRWGTLPGIVRYGAHAHDLEIWGTRTDDPAWQAHMARLDERYARLEARRAQGSGPAQATPIGPATQAVQAAPVAPDGSPIPPASATSVAPAAGPGSAPSHAALPT